MPTSVTIEPALVFGTALPARMGESTGTEYWVDATNGSSGNTGTSIGSPKQTLAQVFALLGTTSSARIYLRNNADHDLGGSTVLFPNNKFGTSRSNPITIETWPADMSSTTGLPGTRGEARLTNGGLLFQPGDLKQNDYNSGNGFNLRLRNLRFGSIPGATTGSGQGTAISAIRCDNVIGFEVYGVEIDSPSFCGALIRGAGRTTTLSASANNSQTTITVSSNTNFVNATPFYAVLGNGDGVEIVQVTNATTTTWTVARGQLGTSVASHASGVTVEGYWRCGDVQMINLVVKEPSDGTTWAINHSHGVYWASDNGFDAVNYPQCVIANAIFSRRNAARGGAYAVNCYENGDSSIITNVLSDGFRRGGVTISGEAVHATNNSLWVNNIITNVDTSSPGPGYAVDSYMTGNFGPGSGNVVRDSLWFTALAYHRTDADANGITFNTAINQDPLFTDRTNGDYRIGNTSPAIGQGDTDYMFPTDIAGNVRTAANYAIGPYVKGA